MAAGARSAGQGLLDTSVFIAREAGRALADLPEAAAVSVVTLAELHLGVLMAQGSTVRARRLRTLTAVQNAFESGSTFSLLYYLPGSGTKVGGPFSENADQDVAIALLP